MSGTYTGLQARIWKLNPLDLYVPCAAHSLNLVGSCAACSCLAATSYFAFLQSLYTFFSASTYRWQMLTDALPPHGLVVKSLPDTRWSARADATRSAFAHYRAVLKIATDTCADTKQESWHKTVGWWTGQADGAVGNCANDSFWHTILERLNVTSLSLQKFDIDLISAVKLCDSLVTFLLQLRDRLMKKEEKAKSYVKIQKYKEATKRRKRLFDESCTPDIQN